MATRAWWRPLANPGTWEAGAAGLISRPAWAQSKIVSQTESKNLNRKLKPDFPWKASTKTSQCLWEKRASREVPDR